MAENWLTTPQAVDLYNFIKQHTLDIIPVRDYDCDREDIEQKIIHMRSELGKTTDRSDLYLALKQLDSDGLILMFENTLNRYTGENYN